MCFFCGCSGPHFKSVKVITPSTVQLAGDKKIASAQAADKKDH